METEQIQELIKAQGFIPLEAIKPKIWKCTDEQGRRFVFKLVSNRSEIDMYQSVLMQLLQRHTNFKRLILPELTKTDGETWIIVPEYTGTDYYGSWNETEPGKIGGIALGTELALEMAEVIIDLRTIDCNEIRVTEEFKNIQKAEFNFDAWLQSFNQKSSQLIEHALISAADIASAREVLNGGLEKSRMVFSCGDYYPRNIIKTTEGKLVLLDWEGWSEGYRVNFIEHEENLMAFAYIHMWNNYLWQWLFLESLQKRLTINPRNFQKALLIKSFDQAFLWNPIDNKNLMPLYLAQMQMFSNALNFEYIKKLLSHTKPKCTLWRWLNPNL